MRTRATCSASATSVVESRGSGRNTGLPSAVATYTLQEDDVQARVEPQIRAHALYDRKCAALTTGHATLAKLARVPTEHRVDEDATDCTNERGS